MAHEKVVCENCGHPAHRGGCLYGGCDCWAAYEEEDILMPGKMPKIQTLGPKSKHAMDVIRQTAKASPSKTGENPWGGKVTVGPAPKGVKGSKRGRR